LRYLVYGALTVLSISTFTVHQRSNLQFKAYSEFALRKSDVVIPIHPQWEEFPSWHIQLPRNSGDSSMKPIDAIALDIEGARKMNVVDIYKDSTTTFNSVNVDPMLIFDVVGKCNRANFIGVEIHIARVEGGWVQIFWGESDAFSEDQSLHRYYPGGDQVVQFAMPAQNLKYLRFDPLDKRGKFSIHSVSLYCLGK